MIIIKSQDGLTITEAHTIYTVETDNGVFIKCNDGTMLGRYKDKDRVRKVMEMIENHIDNCCEEKQYTNENRATYKWIFTMPKEVNYGN